MKFNIQELGKTRNNQFGKLGLWYILALSTIATIIILGQILIQNHLSTQLSDSRVINVAGRQRMLSQKIVKLALLIEKNTSQALIDELDSTTDLWTKCHHGLRDGDSNLELPGNNSSIIDSMFLGIQPYHDAMIMNVRNLLFAVTKSDSVSTELIRESISNQIAESQPFLNGMDRIVNQYDKEAKEKVRFLSRLEYALLFVSLLVILLEVLFIFRPTAQHVNKTFKKLIASEKNANKMAKEISAIYTSLEKSYEQIAKVNEPDEIPVVWAKSDQGGNITNISDSYRALSGVVFNKRMRVCDLFPESGLGDEFMDDLVETISEDENWSGQVHCTTSNKELWLNVTICPVLGHEGRINEVLVMGTNITSRKQAEQDMYQKNRNEVEKRINQQKYRSVLILEGQEEERKRLAMDIHDGIGQLLTSLKFQIESINPDEGALNSEKLSEIKSQLNDTIKEVRRVTFNLKPTVLDDYGLAAGLRLFINEIAKFSEVKVEFLDEQNITERFSPRVENNAFRVVQEAINNAIKHAKPSLISVSLAYIGGMLQLRIKDDGQGFNPSTLKDVSIESGSGFFNMYERTEYINGKLEIDSMPGHGTTIILTVPVRQTINT